MYGLIVGEPVDPPAKASDEDAEIVVPKLSKGTLQLLRACLKNNVERARAAIANGADVDIQTDDLEGLSPLCYCAHYEYPDIVEELVKGGAALDGDDARCYYTFYDDNDVYWSDCELATPLFFAACGGSAPCVKVLLDGGADKSAKTSKRGLTALDAARDNLQVYERALESNPGSRFYDLKRKAYREVVALLQR